MQKPYWIALYAARHINDTLMQKPYWIALYAARTKVYSKSLMNVNYAQRYMVLWASYMPIFLFQCLPDKADDAWNIQYWVGKSDN